MKAYLANMMLGALHIVSKKLFNWATDPDRHRKIRFRHREMWYGWQQAAIKKDSAWRMRVATAYGIQWRFITPPDEAKRRGDLD